MLDIQLNHRVLEVDQSYCTFVHTAVEHISPGSTVKVRENHEGFIISVFPADLELKKEIVTNLLGLHKSLGIKPDFSKSTNITKNIHFKIKSFSVTDTEELLSR